MMVPLHPQTDQHLESFYLHFQLSQAIASEIDLERLLTRLMRITIEYTGAQRGALILEHDGEWLIEAQAEANSQEITVLQSIDPRTSATISAELVALVARTRDSVLLDDAGDNEYAHNDPYFANNQIRSVLCLSLINQNQPSAILYLENNRAPHAFTARHLGVLNLLAPQMALAIDHARQYRGLESRVAELTRSLAETQEAVEAANRAKSSFLSSINHDLRSPLNAILGFASMLQREVRTGRQTLTAEQLHKISRIQASGERLLALINKVLDRSLSIEAGEVAEEEEKEGAEGSATAIPLPQTQIDISSLSSGLARLPVDLLSRLEQAAMGAHMAEVDRLIREIQGFDLTVAQILGDMAIQFDYPRMAQIIQGIYHETGAQE